MVGSGRGGRAASARPLFVKIGSAGDIVGFVRLRGGSEVDEDRDEDREGPSARKRGRNESSPTDP